MNLSLHSPKTLYYSFYTHRSHNNSYSMSPHHSSANTNSQGKSSSYSSRPDVAVMGTGTPAPSRATNNGQMSDNERSNAHLEVPRALHHPSRFESRTGSRFVSSSEHPSGPLHVPSSSHSSFSGITVTSAPRSSFLTNTNVPSYSGSRSAGSSSSAATAPWDSMNAVASPSSWPSGGNGQR
jgi:hypothetical protein